MMSNHNYELIMNKTIIIKYVVIKDIIGTKEINPKQNNFLIIRNAYASVSRSKNRQIAMRSVLLS